MKSQSNVQCPSRTAMYTSFICILVFSMAVPRSSSQESDIRNAKHSILRRHPDSPLEEAKFRLLQESGGTLIVTREAFLAALQALGAEVELAKRNQNRTVAGVPVRVGSRDELATAELEKSIWESLGTNGIGGRTRSIVIDNNKKTIWIGAVGGGIWRSDDSGQTFENVDDHLSSLAISCMTTDSNGTVYAGTGELFAVSDGIKGVGLLWSRDGKHWEQIPATKTNRSFEYVNRLAAAPSPSKTLLAATASGILRSTDDQQRNDWAPTSLTLSMADVRFSPDGTVAVAGGYGLNSDNMWIGDGTVNSYFSTDDGRTWKKSTHTGRWLGRVELAFAKSDSKIVYASVDNNSGELWMSKDGGKSFEKRDAKTVSGTPAYFLGDPSGDPQYDQGTYANALWAGDKDPQTVIVGGLDLWISKDGGKTLRPISDWQDSTSAHADQHAIVAMPGFEKAGGSIFFANDGGIFEAPDISKLDSKPPYYKGWKNNNTSYRVTQFYSGAVFPKNGTIIGGTQDNGMLRMDSQTLTWAKATKDGGGDGGASGVSGAGIFYGEYENLRIHRSLDDGSSYLYISGQYWDPCAKNPDKSTGAYKWKNQPFAIVDAETGTDALFIAPFVVDPNNDKRIYAGGRSLWLTDNGDAPNIPNDIVDDCPNTPPSNPVQLSGPSWTPIKSPIGLGNPNLISAISLSSEQQPTIWVGYVNGNIYKTTGGTTKSPTWSDALNKDVAGWPSRYCLSITVDPHNPDIVYATFGGYESDNVWKTTNGGKDWKSIGKSLPKAPIRSVAIHPTRSLFVYLGTEVGLFASEDGGQSWSPTNEGPTNAPVDQLFWNGNFLLAATHGRGMWQIKLP